MIWSNKMLHGALTVALTLAAACNKKSAADESTDLTEEGTPLVVSGNQPVTGGSDGGITVNKTDDGVIFSGNDDADTTPPVAGGDGVINVNGFTPSTISISWTAATDNSGSVIYDVYSSTTQTLATLADLGKPGVSVVKAGVTVTNYTLTGLVNGTNYFIAVVAKDSLGNKALYQYVTQTAQVQNTSISAATSVVSIVGGASTVASGSSIVVQLRARDSAGNNLTGGGAVVVFTKAGAGTSTFTQTFPVTATDQGNGTYSATLTGLNAGTAVSLGAKINGTSTSSTANIAVTPGIIAATTSVLEIVENVNTVAHGANVTLRLRAKDAAGNFLTAGGSAVAFTKSGGTSTFLQAFALGATDNNDGTYTATVTGDLAGTAATIGATIGVTPVTATTTLGVSAGVISASTSAVSIVGGASTVASGSSVVVKLQAKDAAGNNLTAGGATITFTKTGGTSSFGQTFPITATDNGDGTYSASITGVTAGTPSTIGAKVGATSVTSTTALAVTSGSISPATSVVSIVGGATTVGSGANVTVRLAAKDAAGNDIATGGGSVTFTQTGGTSTFTQSFPVAATDNGDGTYTAVVTGNASGSAKTLGAKIGATAVTSTTSLAVTNGAISATTSTIQIVGGATTVASGSSVTVRLQGKDAAGNTLTAGGGTVAFTISGGTSTLTQSFPLSATDVGDGTYTATLTGLLAGTATTIKATVGAATTTASTTLAVTPGTISAANSAVSLVGNPTTVASGSNVTIRLQAKDAAGNNLLAGGSTVSFTKTGGTSTFTQTFAVAATDAGNGTYTATLTGAISGTATTLGGKIGATDTTSTVPLQVIPGPISTTVSVVSAGASTVSSGVGVQVKLDARDAQNNNITVGGSTVAFTVSGGTSSFSGSFPRAATDNGDGTYTATLTGATAGTAKTIGATIGGTAATSTTTISVNSNVGATITGAPTGTNNTTALNVTIGGTSVVNYMFKVGLSSATDCSNATGYSGSTAVATLITASLVGLADDDLTLCVVGADGANNWQAYAAATTASWVKKATPPSFTSLDLINQAADGYINAADKLLTNPLGGNLVGADYTTAAYKLVTNATACNGSLTYGSMPNDNSADFGADGTYKICVKLTDTVGNTPAYGASTSFALKTSTIAFTSLARANEAADGYINSADKVLSSALAGSLSGSNYDTAAYKLVTNGTTCNGSLTYGAMPNNDSSDFGVDGAYKVCAKLSDNAGNPPAYGSTVAITLKTSVLSFTSLALVSDAADGYINAAEKVLTNALAGSLSASNYDTAAYKLVASATACNVSLTYGSMPLDNSSDFGSDGTYKVCVKLTDNAANTPVYGASATITLKTSTISFTSLARAGEAADGYINAADKLLTNALAGSLVGANYDTAGYKLAASGVTCDNTLTYGSMPLDNSSDFGSDGNYKVCVKLSDNAGNTVKFGATANFALKTSTPSFSSLALINDAADGYVNIAERALNAALAGSLSATNYDTADYVLAASATACNGSLTYGSMPLDNSTDFGSDGTYKVCVRLQDSAGNPAAYGSSSTMILDTAAPTVAFSSSSTNPTNANPIPVTVTFSEAVTGFISSDVSVTGSSLSGFAGTGASYSFNLAPASITVTANIASAAATDVAGNPNTAASQFSRTYDNTVPTVASVTSTNTDGTYGVGNAIDITVTLSEAVTVTGTPLLTLNTTPSRTASYSSGSGSTVLTFTYTTQSGDATLDLEYASTSALATNGGSIKDSAGNNATLTLPTVQTANSLGGSKAIVIDTSAATITLVDSTMTGAVKAGTVVPIQLNFDDVVTVTGTPRILLNTSPARYATYCPTGTCSGNNNTSPIIFNYTVQAGDTAGVLDYASVNAVDLNGGTLRDSASAAIVNTLPTLGGGSSLATANISVDTTNPTITNVTSTTPDSTYSVGYQVDVLVSFTEPVVVTGTPLLQLNVTNTAATTRYASYNGGSGTGTLTFTYTVQGPNDATGDISSELEYSSTTALSLNGGTIADAATNAATLTLVAPGAAGSLSANSTIVIDASQPPALGISGVTSTTDAAATVITVQYPANVASYANVNVYRDVGATPPSSDCASGTLVKNYNSGFVAGATKVFIDRTANPGKSYSYRVCAMSGASAILGTATESNVKASILQWIFTTKNAVASGSLGGISGANATCQTAGNTIDSTLTWLAVLSDTAVEAKGRIGVVGAVYNRASTPASVATTSNGLFGANSGRQYAEDGTATTGSAWTGTTGAGLRQKDANRCQTSGVDWTSSSSGVAGHYGTVTAAASNTWLAATTTSTSTCNTATNRLYCVSKAMEPLTSFTTTTPTSGTAGDVTVAIDFPSDTTNWTKAEIRRLKPTWNTTTLQWVSPTCTTGTVAKTWNGPTFTDETFTDATAVPSAYYMYTVCVYSGTNVSAAYTTVAKPTRTYSGGSTYQIFLTSSTQTGGFPSYAGANGLARADTFCQTRGDTFSTGKTWKAILSTSTVSAASRVSASGEVRNLVGQVIGTSYSDLFDNTLGAAITYMDTFGTYTSTAIWTGSTTAGLVDGTNTCSDWSLNTGGTGRRGTGNSLTGTWLNNGSTSTCSSARKIWCISATPD